MSLPCPKCKKRTVEIREFHMRKVTTDNMSVVSDLTVVEALCSECHWRYREADEAPQQADWSHSRSS